MNAALLPDARLDLVLAAIIRPELASMQRVKKIPHTATAERLPLA